MTANREQASVPELKARWAYRVKNEVGVALHAMDVGNYAAARVALEGAMQYIGMLESQERADTQAQLPPGTSGPAALGPS